MSTAKSRLSGHYHCKTCDHGSNYRLTIKCSTDSEPILFYANENYGLSDILTILNIDYPEIWKEDIIYYFHLDMDGVYHHIEDSSWLRDKDILIISTETTLIAKPKISFNAVHASLKSNITLKPHQEDGVKRMIQMELDYRGGILGDEMGLGKTIQAISLIMRQQSLYVVHACTLVVVPSIDIANQWADEIRSKTDYGSLPYFIYQNSSAELLSNPYFRVVITTYDKLRYDFRKDEVHITGADESAETSPLYQVRWHRIVLDESHKVRDRTLLLRCVKALNAKFRWCLTGTPFQNNAAELYPIFSFLDVKMDPKKKNNETYLSKLLHKHMIRRTKEEFHVELDLFPIEEIRIVLEFSKPEQALYNYLERLFYARLKHIKDSSNDALGFTNVTTFYIRLKQLCGHHMILLQKFPDLITFAVKQRDTEITDNLENITVDEEQSYYNEPEVINSINILESYYNQFGYLEEPIDLDQLYKLKFMKYSTKQRWLANYIKDILENDATEKVVVVSQFVDVLLKVVEILENTRIKFETYYGSMSSESKKISLNKFTNNSSIRVLLLSLKAGGVGLNLQRANHMIILDRWWNPATMSQAVGRIYRMTQAKKTFVHTLVIKDTIEDILIENILNRKKSSFQKIVNYCEMDTFD